MRWSDGQARVSREVIHPAPLRTKREEAIATFADLVRRAVRRRASPKVPYILPLSGGRDSRSIFLELMALGCRPRACITNHDFPYYRTQNIEVSRQIARRFDLPYAGGTPTPPTESNVHYRRTFLETLTYMATHSTGELVRRGPMTRRLLTLAVSGGICACVCAGLHPTPPFTSPRSSP